MKTLRLSSAILQSLVEQRRRTGAGRLDECWEGEWRWTDPSARHQKRAFAICRVHAEVVEDAGRGTAWISINVTDREEGWIDNHRCPDGAVILTGNTGRWIGGNQAAFLGGPDLVLEVLSEDDDTYLKLPFYRDRGVREVLIVDQEVGRAELWRLSGREYARVPEPLRSEITGLVYVQGSEALEIRDPSTDRTWRV